MIAICAKHWPVILNLSSDGILTIPGHVYIYHEKPLLHWRDATQGQYLIGKNFVWI